MAEASLAPRERVLPDSEMDLTEATTDSFSARHRLAATITICIPRSADEPGAAWSTKRSAPRCSMTRDSA
jgi:hypothetical protein